MYVVNAVDGNVHWKYETGGQVKSSPAVDMNTGFIYVGSHDHNIYSFVVQVCILIVTDHVRAR